MADVLTLGGIQFTDYSTPDIMSAGGKQQMVVHKLPGGQRVIDTLGPDEAQITWHGTLFSNNAFSMALQLDAMRAAGQVVALMWAGQFRQVLIASFTWSIRRLPIWLEYSIECTVVSNPSLGNLGVVASSAGSLAASDLAAAGAIVGVPPPVVTPDPGGAFTSGANPVPFGGVGGLGPQS